jgi:acyl-CoA thioesterase
VLVASAVERSRAGRDGVYDVSVRAGDTLVADFVGHSKEVRGVLFTDEAS